jgi:hypothetical protein
MVPRADHPASSVTCVFVVQLGGDTAVDQDTWQIQVVPLASFDDTQETPRRNTTQGRAI